jgi:hypothetical protein
MGIDISNMSLWEINAMITGYCRANGGKTDEALSDDEVDQLSEVLRHAAA